MKGSKYKITKVGAIHYIFNIEGDIEFTEDSIRNIINQINNDFKVYTNSHIMVTRFERDGNIKNIFQFW